MYNLKYGTVLSILSLNLHLHLLYKEKVLAIELRKFQIKIE